MEMATRKQALASLSFDRGWERNVIDLLENGGLPEELVKAAASKLLTAARPVDRAEGRKYLDGLTGEEAELPSIEVMVQSEGDVARGKAVFGTYCQTCHQVNGAGTAFGPDLSEIANKLGKDALFSSIIYPDAAISHGFEGVHFETKDGTHHMGYILSENQEKVELKVQTGPSVTLFKADIAKREALDHSLMTSGLARAMGEADLVNVVSFLSTLSNQRTMASNPYQGKIGFEREKE